MTSSGAWASNGPTPTPWTPSTCPEVWRFTRPTRWWTTTATATPGTSKKVVLAELQESLNWSLPGVNENWTLFCEVARIWTHALQHRCYGYCYRERLVSEDAVSFGGLISMLNVGLNQVFSILNYFSVVWLIQGPSTSGEFLFSYHFH